jgi:TetR/AcrR family transcriptional repressor of mexJK operon
LTSAGLATRPTKLRAITEAASAAFLERGYGGASLDHIAARAGVSKQTIYNRFGDKAGLFRAICRELTADLVAPLAETSGDDDPRRMLLLVGEGYLRLALAESSLALHRLVIQESARFPDFGRAVYEAGPERLVAELSAYLGAQADAGRLRLHDPAQAAEFFLAMLLGQSQLRALLGVPRDEAVTARAHAAVEVFFQAFGPQG